jgi:hypothetical protein
MVTQNVEPSLGIRGYRVCIFPAYTGLSHSYGSGFYKRLNDIKEPLHRKKCNGPISSFPYTLTSTMLHYTAPRYSLSLQNLITAAGTEAVPLLTGFD